MNIKFNNKIVKLENVKSYDKLIQFIDDKFNLKRNSYYLHNNIQLINRLNFNFRENETLIIRLKVNGGLIGKFFKIIINALFKFLDPLSGPFKDIIMTLILCTKLLIDFAGIFPKIVMGMLTIFTPDKFINQILYGSIAGIKLIFGKFLNSFDSDAVSKHENENDKHNNGPFGVSRESQAQNKNVCVSPSLFRLIILVLCPPLAIFLNKGLAGILSVILCSLMTYFLYYFPGFIYAALITLC